MSRAYQLFDALPSHIEDALKASIERFGVLVPVVYDQHGNIIDGHHRSRIADELNVKYRSDTVVVADEDEAKEVARTLNADRRQLDEEQRRKVSATLREAGHSYRAIGGALGISHTQARQDVETERLESSFQSEPDRVKRQGGGSYPSRRPPVVASKTDRERERAQEALATLGDATKSGVYDTKRVERLAREHAAEQRRAQPIEPVTAADDIEIRHGDFRDMLSDLDGTVDAIITDPPYPKEFGELWEDLGKVAAQLLKPSGVLAVMCGTRLELLYHAENAIGSRMRRRWMGVYLTPGQRWRDQVERVATGWKPILIYSHPKADADSRRWIQDDVFNASTESSADKRFHHWGQNEEGFADLVGRLSEPGQLVVDPFLGGGTTAVVCRGLGRRFVGCDIDAAAVHTSRERI